MVSEDTLRERWLEELSKTIPELPAKNFGKKYGSGRDGDHTPDLNQALEILAEVYESDKDAVW